MEGFLLKALVEDGGMWGIMAALSFFWALYVGKLARDKKDDVIKQIQVQSGKIRELELQNVEHLESLNKLSEERIEDLRQILEEYHRTMSDTALAIEHIKIIMENKL